MSYLSHSLIVKAANLKSFDRIRSLLNKECTQLGSGAFGTVYTHPDNDKVIKVCTNRDAYYQFARWCMLPENVNNPHLPNIYEERVIISDDENERPTFIYVIEQLSVPQRNLNDDNHTVERARDIPNVICGQYWKATHEMISRFKWNHDGFNNHFKSKIQFIHELHQYVIKNHKEDPTRWPHSSSMKQLAANKLFIDTTYKILSMFSAIAHLDYHGGNIMWKKSPNSKRNRNHGVLVITDPVAAFYTTYTDSMKRKSNSYCEIKHTTTTGKTQFGFTAPVVYEHCVSLSYNVSHDDLCINTKDINSLFHV